MPFFHCSPEDQPIGLRLTGPELRGEVSRWQGKVEGHDGTKVYVFEGACDPLELLSSTACAGSAFLYEVEPEGERSLDLPGPMWTAWKCEAATVKACIYRPGTDRWS
jgi:hypothetical protein